MSSFKKLNSSVINKANVSTTSPEILSNKNKILGNLSKWIPLVCAGAAVGVSILALKEIKNVRRELIELKNDQILSNSNLGSQSFDPELLKRIELMDEQIVKISKYLGTQQNKEKKPKINKVINEEPEIILEKVKEVIIDLNSSMNHIKNEKIPSPKVVVLPEPVKESITEIDEEEYEYEEVTDDEE